MAGFLSQPFDFWRSYLPYLRTLMKLLIKQARITDPSSPHNGQVADILISDGTITRIASAISESADLEINIPQLHVSPGWVDLFAQFGDPGLEYKETLETGAAAAAAGGFTDILILPNTNPCDPCSTSDDR